MKPVLTHQWTDGAGVVHECFLLTHVVTRCRIDAGARAHNDVSSDDVATCVACIGAGDPAVGRQNAKSRSFAVAYGMSLEKALSKYG